MGYLVAESATAATHRPKNSMYATVGTPGTADKEKRMSERKKLIRFTEFLKLPKYKGADRQI